MASIQIPTIGFTNILLTPNNFMISPISANPNCPMIFKSSPTSSYLSSRSKHVIKPICASSYPGDNTPLVNNEEQVKFTQASKRGNVVPLSRCLFSDHLTPVLAYRCLVKEDDRDAPSFLYESVEPGVKSSTLGRFSIVGAHPTLEIVAKENKVTVMDHDLGSMVEEYVEDPMAIPQRITANWKPELIDELPETFCGGWVGYFGYDTVRYGEKKLPFTSAPKDDRNLPDFHLGLYDDIIIFDHVQKRIHVIHWVRLDRHSSVEAAYNYGVSRMEKLMTKLQEVEPPRIRGGFVDLQTCHFGTPVPKSSVTREDFKRAILEAKEHIKAGDIFQIVLCQRFERRTFADPFEIYRALRVVNPSPYMAYLQARGCIMVSSSPEILTTVKKGKIINRPLAGTIRRGKNEEEDQKLELKLLHDAKQCAEHVTLVDLARNDVGKVSKPGTVKIEKLMNIERYSHVMHISSTIIGQLDENLSAWDALRVAIPVGTVTGAPKVKAMQLIDELEANRRGPYSGGFGSVSFTGDMDVALTLRTMVFPTGNEHDTMYYYGEDGGTRKEWVAHLQAGANIITDSDPDDEHQECLNKAVGLARAIDLAESAFVFGRIFL
ncbi:hypothetical protein ACFE04_018234 [Oxalis oulophora]